MPEVDAPRIRAILGELDLDEVLGGAVGAAAHGAAFAAESGDGVGVEDAAVVGVFCLVFDALQAACFTRFGDVVEGTFADVH